jgi:hypothetical protein
MAQSGYTPILIYASSTTTNVPLAANLTNSSSGAELAINYFDGKLFYKDNAGVVQVLAWKTTPTSAGGTGLTSWTAGQIPYYSSGTTLSQLNIGTNGFVLTSNGTAPIWSSPPTGTPGGSTTQVQFNNAGSFGGMSGVTWDGSALTIANSKLTGTTSAFASILTNAAETVNYVLGAVNFTPTSYFNTGAVQFYASFATANWTQNLTYSVSTTLNSALAVGQAATIAILATQGSTAYYMNGTLTIDGFSANVTTVWQGGSAPTTGFTTGIDVYTYTVIKTSATPAYTVLATQTQF